MDKLTDFSRRVRVDIVASAAEVEPLLAIIQDVCHTSREGDGVVWGDAGELLSPIMVAAVNPEARVPTVGAPAGG